VTALDLLPTLSRWLGAPPAPDPIDGLDVGACLRDDAPSPREDFAYYARGRLEAVRDTRYKLVFSNPLRDPPTPRALYDLQADPGETTDLAALQPGAVQALEALAERYRSALGDTLTGARGRERRADPP
jgi:arylsulfatase A-like enzyme